MKNERFDLIDSARVVTQGMRAAKDGVLGVSAGSFPSDPVKRHMRTG